MTPFRHLHTLFCLSVFSFAAAAQTTYTAQKIVFKNPGLFSQQQLETVSGMHAGSPANATTMAAAAQKLADTGYFDDIGCQLDGTAANTTVIFNLKPIPKSGMTRVGFENFVWLTHDEIEAALLAKFPLYIDLLPENSPAADTLDAALVEALAAKSITAVVQHETIEPTLQHPFRVLQFRIVSPTIAVTGIDLLGVGQSLVPLVQKSVNTTARTLYNEAPAGRVTSESILAPLLDAGYLQASLSDLKLAPLPAANTRVGLNLTANLRAGDIYHVSHITFAGAPLYTAAAFTAAQKLHDGDIASRKALLETLTPLDAAYRRQGYMDVVIQTSPTLDDATRQVAYTVTVEPNEPYRLNQITAYGLDPAAQADYNKYFLLKKGDPFNPEYVSDFIKNNTALSSLAPYTANWHASADPNTHTVDLTIDFAGGSSSKQSITVH